MAGDGFTCGWYVVEVRNEPGQRVSVAFRFRRDVVEIWLEDRCKAIFDRDRFRSWLDWRSGTLVEDDVMWTPTEGGHVALVIRDSGWWSITTPMVDRLRERV